MFERMCPASFCRLAALFAAAACSCAESKIVLDDENVSVTVIDVTPAGEYKVEGARPHGSVWVALSDGALLLQGASSAVRTVHAGEAEFVAGGTGVSFRSAANRPTRLIVVAVKRRSQELTVHTTELKAGRELHDASDRNDTLLIPVSTVRLLDVRNLGDESEWKPSGPEVIRMLPGQVGWVRAGIHHFKNLLASPCAFVTVEW